MSASSPTSPSRSGQARLTIDVHTPMEGGRSRSFSGARNDQMCVPEKGTQLAQSSNIQDTDLPHHLDYSVPNVVESLRQGRLDSCGAAAVVSALFASIEATMIALIKTPYLTSGAIWTSPTVSAGAIRLLLILSYSGLMLNSSTTFSALLLIDRLGKLNYDSMKQSELCVTRSSLQSGRQLLGRYGASGRVWDIVEFHYFATLLVGGLNVLGQLLTFIWIYEGHAVAVISTFTTVFCVIPFLMVFLW
ncbi:hypothetical protein FRB93_004238 [Tulasnella sp. JGI-2019a]|nr:hypothetical protein FRB93_004238 [Tulasnella sp. JGI-2019a]